MAPTQHKYDLAQYWLEWQWPASLSPSSSFPRGTCGAPGVASEKDYKPEYTYEVPHLHNDIVQSENTLKIHLV